MKSHCCFPCRIGRTAGVVVFLSMLAAVRPLAAAGPGVQGVVLALDERGNITGLVPGAAIELTNQAGQVVGSATADAQGAYRLDAPAGTYTYKVRAQGYRDENVGRGFQLRLSEGYSVYNFSLTKGKAGPNPAPQVPAVEIGKLQGRVLEERDDGQRVGIPGATISLRGGGDKRLTTVLAGGQSGSTAAGHYEIALAAGAWQASALAPGFQTSDPCSIQIPAGKNARHDFILVRRHAPSLAGSQGIRGLVRINDANLPAGTQPPVKISIVAVSSSGGSAARPSADGQGNFSQELPPGGYRVSAEALGYPTVTSGPTAVFPTKFSVVDLTLSPPPPPLTFEATVYEQTGGERAEKRLLPGAMVRVSPEAGTANAKAAAAPTDNDGAVQLTIFGGLGTYRAVAAKAGYRPQRIAVVVRDASEHHAAQFILSKAKSLPFAGQVFEQTGDDPATKRPLANAAVQLRQQGLLTSGPVTTDERGLARLSGFPGDYQAEARMAGLGSQTLDVVVRDGGENRAEFVLKRRRAALSFEAQVFGQTGDDAATRRPLRNATISLRKQPAATAAETQAATDAQGDAQVDVRGGPGDYQATASMDGYQPESLGVTIRGSDEHHAAQFVLRKLSPPLTLAAQVYVQRGEDRATRRPLAGATVQVCPQGGAAAAPMQDQTDDRGQTEFSVLTGPGQYQATASKPGLGSQTLLVAVAPAGDNAAEFVLKRAVPLLRFQGAVYVQDGREPAHFQSGATVRIWSQGWSSAGTSDERGQVYLFVPAAGDYQAEATLQGYEPSHADVAISAGGPNGRRFVLVRGAAALLFRAKVLGRSGDEAGGTPLDRAHVWLSNGTQKVEGWTAGGEVSLRAPAGPGVYHAGAEMQGWEPNQTDVTVDPNSTSHTFILHRSRQPTTFTATVVDNQKKALPGATVHLRQEGGQTSEGVTDGEGVVRLAISPGNAAIQADAELRGYSATGPVQIPSGATSHTFVLKKAGGLTAGPGLVSTGSAATLTVIVVGEDLGGARRQLGDAVLRLARENRRAAPAAKTAADGTHVFHLAPGKYRLHVEMGGYAPGDWTVTVNPGDTEWKCVLHASPQAR